MKVKDKYKIINYAVKTFNKTFNHNVVSQKYSKRLIEKLMKEYPYWGLIESHFCCNGLYQCCWEEVCEEGVWDLTLSDVRYIIKSNLKSASKTLRRHDRFYIDYQDDKVTIVAVLRDTKYQCDYKIMASKKNFK